MSQEEIISDIRKYYKINENKKKLLGSTEAVFRRKFISINTNVRNEGKF